MSVDRSDCSTWSGTSEFNLTGKNILIASPFPIIGPPTYTEGLMAKASTLSMTIDHPFDPDVTAVYNQKSFDSKNRENLCIPQSSFFVVPLISTGQETGIGATIACIFDLDASPVLCADSE